MKSMKLVLAFSIMLMMVFPLMGNASMNAAGLELASSSGTVGFELSIKGTGLTSGGNYIVIAEHSDGNLTSVSTAVGSVAYFKIKFTAADSDNIVPITLDTYNLTSGAAHGTDDASALFTLSAASIPGQEFFTGIIGSLLVIGIVVGLAGIFVLKRRGK